MHHQHTRLYQRSLELVTLANQVIKALPSGYGFLADQLRRASSSVVLNFAEGCGKRTTAERRRFLDIAKGSTYEVAAALDVAQRFGAIPQAEHAEGQDLCDHIAAMLHRFARAQ